MDAAAHKLFVGIDVAATSATVAWLTPGGTVSRPCMIDQTPAGFAKLQQQLTALG